MHFAPLFLLLLPLALHALGLQPLQRLLSPPASLSTTTSNLMLPELPTTPASNVTNTTKATETGSKMFPYLFTLKRRPSDPVDYDKHPRTQVIEELECSESMFFSPYHNPVEFAVNDSIYERIEKTCKWSLIGTEPCIPLLTCETAGDCANEFAEITDGNKGYSRLCGNARLVNVTAANDLRDLYIKFTVIRPPTKPRNGSNLFYCSVSCSKRGQGQPLPTPLTPIVSPKCYCGTKPNEDRIVGGENAKKSEFPWLVALVETNTRQPFCGGSIVNSMFVLTAGHCIKGKFVDYRNMQVIINGHAFDSSPNLNVVRERDKVSARTYTPEELLKLDQGNGSLRVNVDEVIVHPLYVSETNDFDVCLLKLSRPLDLSTKSSDLNATFQPPRSICLPDLGSYLRTYSNKKATIAGWGLPDIDAEGTPLVLQKLEVNVFSPQVCKNMYAHRVNRRMMCAGHREGGKDACAGDSGGPLVVEDRTRVWVQVASVSWGEGCAVPENPGVYFRTTESGQWVHYHSNSNGAVWCTVPP